MNEFHVPSQTPNFIAGWYISEYVCDGLIQYFEEHPGKKPGETGRGIDPEFKSSTDVSVNPRSEDPRICNYMDELTKVCHKYMEKFPWSSKQQSAWGVNTVFNIQKYQPGEAFFGWHSERTTWADVIPFRHLVFMTYLNDVHQGGETEWLHQQIKVQPRKGLTLIWPTDWTHVHRGTPALNEVKYVITGWYTYMLPRRMIDYDAYNGET